MTRERALVIAGALALIGALFAVSIWLGSGAKNTPSPSPSLSAPARPVGPAPVPVPTLTPVSTPTATADPHAGDEHDHGPVTDCDTGPVACDKATDVVRNTREDVTAADAVRPAITAFITAWTTVNSAEGADARAVRLAAAGAADTVSRQVSALSRPKTTLSGLTVSTTPEPSPLVLFTGRVDGLLRFQVLVNVDAQYTLPDDSRSFRVVGGSVYVFVTEQGTVQKVTEDFPTISAMQ